MGDKQDRLLKLAGMVDVSGYQRVSTLGKSVHVNHYRRTGPSAFDVQPFQQPGHALKRLAWARKSNEPIKKGQTSEQLLASQTLAALPVPVAPPKVQIDGGMSPDALAGVQDGLKYLASVGVPITRVRVPSPGDAIPDDSDFKPYAAGTLAYVNGNRPTEINLNPHFVADDVALKKLLSKPPEGLPPGMSRMVAGEDETIRERWRDTVIHEGGHVWVDSLPWEKVTELFNQFPFDPSTNDNPFQAGPNEDQKPYWESMSWDLGAYAGTNIMEATAEAFLSLQKRQTNQWSEIIREALKKQ